VDEKSGTFDDSVVAKIVGLVSESEPRCGRFRVVAIDGPAGAGKTTLAAAVAGALGAAVLHMDDLYAGWTGLRAGIELAHTAALQPLSLGRTVAVPTFDWERDQYVSLTPLNVKSVLIVEGVGAGALGLEEHVSVLVFVDGPESSRKVRAVGRGGEDFDTHWDAWASLEAQYWTSDRPRERAHYVVAATAE
jgi:uridine kinase